MMPVLCGQCGAEARGSPAAWSCDECDAYGVAARCMCGEPMSAALGVAYCRICDAPTASGPETMEN